MRLQTLALITLVTFGVNYELIAAENEEPGMAMQTEKKVVTLDVPGMFCPTCPFTVRKSLEAQDGVLNVEVSSQTKTAVVTYDPSKVGIKALIEATTNVGYPSTVKNGK